MLHPKVRGRMGPLPPARRRIERELMNVSRDELRRAIMGGGGIGLALPAAHIREVIMTVASNLRAAVARTNGAGETGRRSATPSGSTRRAGSTSPTCPVVEARAAALRGTTVPAACTVAAARGIKPSPPREFVGEVTRLGASGAPPTGRTLPATEAALRAATERARPRCEGMIVGRWRKLDALRSLMKLEWTSDGTVARRPGWKRGRRTLQYHWRIMQRECGSAPKLETARPMCPLRRD